jgi:hypothetical protein
MAGTFAQAKGLGVSLRLTQINGQPGLMFFDEGGRIGAVMSLDIADGVVQTIRSVINPAKLAHLGARRECACHASRGTHTPRFELGEAKCRAYRPLGCLGGESRDSKQHQRQHHEDEVEAALHS